MKIVLATGIFYPEIGGPALLVKQLAESLSQSGQEPLVLTYANAQLEDFAAPYPVVRIKRGSKLANYFKYFLALLKNVESADKVMAFDTFSAALPVAVAGLVKGFKFKVRLGGDFLWETAVNKLGKAVALTDYYQTRFSLTEKVYFSLIKFIFWRAEKIVATTEYQAKIVKENYNVAQNKFIFIKNAFPKSSQPFGGSMNGPLIFAGRFTKVKNLKNLLKAFSQIKDGSRQLWLIGAGPEEQDLKATAKALGLEKKVVFRQPLFGHDLVDVIRNASFLILPSLSDISPNIVLQAVSAGAPVLMTQHSGWYEDFNHRLFFIKNPLNILEIADKLDFLLGLDKDDYAACKYAVAKIDTSYSEEQMNQKYLIAILS